MVTIDDVRRLEKELHEAQERRSQLLREAEEYENRAAARSQPIQATQVEISRLQRRVQDWTTEMEKLRTSARNVRAHVAENDRLAEGIRRRLADLRYELEGARLKANGVAGYDARVKVGLYPPRRR